MNRHLVSRSAALKPFIVLLGLAGMMATGTAQADQSYCDSPWLKPNVRLSGSVDGAKARFAVRVEQVNRISAQECTASLTVDADAPIAEGAGIA